MKRYDVVIVGGGASGMFGAIALAKGGKKVALIEQASRGGKKILASGNGRCNIANSSIGDKNFTIANRKIIQELLSVIPWSTIETTFKDLGLEFTTLPDGRVFPKSLSAKSVLDLLETWVKRLRVDCFYNVKHLTITEQFRLEFLNNTLKAKFLILATGSMAAPQLGGSKSGLDIAAKFNHTILTPLPALVPLISSNRVCKALAGLKVDALVHLFVDGVEVTSKRGDLLFTKYGLSGLAILDISIDAVKALHKSKETKVVIDYCSTLNQKELLKKLKARVNKERNLPMQVWLEAIIHPKLANEILQTLALASKSEANLNSSNLKEIVKFLKNHQIVIEGYRPMQYAEVALGGVDSKEVDAKTLESKKQKRLYFCGEILDCVGDRGGYNFYFAWASALRVAKSILDNEE